MIDKLIRDKIEKRAFEIYEWRQANGIVGNHLDDWFQAQQELIDKRQIKGCPKCNYKLIARDNGKIICLNNSCNWETEAKRNTDKNLADFKELKKDFNG